MTPSWVTVLICITGTFSWANCWNSVLNEMLVVYELDGGCGASHLLFGRQLFQLHDVDLVDRHDNRLVGKERLDAVEQVHLYAPV